MLSTPYPVARAPSGPGRFVSPVRIVSRSARDWSAVRRTWARAFNDFDARVSAVVGRSKRNGAAPANAAREWCVACLSDVRAALYELHVRILNVDLSSTREAPEIVAYLSEAYVWSGDVMGAVEILLDPREGSEHRALALAEDSGSYIADFLSPLFDKVCSARGPGVGPTRRGLQAVAERLHVAIVSLNWALMAS